MFKLNRIKSLIILLLATLSIAISGCNAYKTITWEQEVIQGTILGSYKHPLTEKTYIRVELDSGEIVSVRGGVSGLQTPNSNKKMPLLVRGKKANLNRGKIDSGKEFYRFIAEKS